ncbi:unnamed protein product [Polarella glacialis]|uniref:Uncharacterized protein n=1 Tax=Polarella glacialis TaxID=89957 RepID=A0A813LID0_POLGL|nr:unnamed protein product [Polarella glacialis]
MPGSDGHFWVQYNEPSQEGDVAELMQKMRLTCLCHLAALPHTEPNFIPDPFDTGMAPLEAFPPQSELAGQESALEWIKKLAVASMLTDDAPNHVPVQQQLESCAVDNTMEQDEPVKELEMHALADLEVRAPSSSSSKTNSSNNNNTAKKPQLQGAAAWHWEQAALQALKAAGGQLPWRHLRRRLVAVYRVEVSMEAGLEDLPDKELGMHALACLEEYASDSDEFFRLPMAQSPTRKVEELEASLADADGLLAKRYKSDSVVQTRGAGEKPPTGLPFRPWHVPRGGGLSRKARWRATKTENLNCIGSGS